MRQTLFRLFAATAGILSASLLQAGPAAPDAKATPPAENIDSEFMRGKLDLQLALGSENSIQDTSPGRPNIDYGLAVARFGYMLDDARGPGWRRGNDEVMLEAIAGPIYTGPGTFLSGLSLLYRRNFVPVGSHFVPYLNLGAGGIYSDAYHHRSQRALGSPFEFDLQADIGVRYLIDAHWSVDLEASFRHLSNASLAARNYGTNALGGLLGVSYGF